MAVHKSSIYCAYCGAVITPEEREVQPLPACFKCLPKGATKIVVQEKVLLSNNDSNVTN